MYTFDEAVQVLFSERINIELLITTDDDGYLFFNFRARPWKNSPNDGRMLLVGAASLDEAFIALAHAFESTDWVPLDWRARMHDATGYPAPAVQPTPQRRPSEPEKLSDRRNTDYPYTRG